MNRTHSYRCGKINNSSVAVHAPRTGVLAAFAVMISLNLATPILSQSADPTADVEKNPVVVLMELGASPQSIAAAGIDPTLIESMIEESVISMQYRHDLKGLDSSISQTSSDLSRITGLLRESGVTEDLEREHADARSRLDGLMTDRAVLITEIRSAVLDRVAISESTITVADLERCLVNSHRRVPTEYRMLELSDEQWSLLERAVSARDGQPLPNDVAAIKAVADGNPRVLLARQRIEQSLGSVMVGFEQAIIDFQQAH